MCPLDRKQLWRPLQRDLVLLRHEFLRRNGFAITELQHGHRGRASDERADQPSAHGCDRVWDVTLGPQRRILWVDKDMIPPAGKIRATRQRQC